MFPGLPSRIESDVRRRYLDEVLRGDESRLKKFRLNVEAPPNRKHMAFVGGAVLSDLMKDTDDGFWITRRSYEELGVERAFSHCRL